MICYGIEADVSTTVIKVHKLLKNFHFRRMSKSVWNLTIVKPRNCLDSDDKINMHEILWYCFEKFHTIHNVEELRHSVD